MTEALPSGLGNLSLLPTVRTGLLEVYILHTSPLEGHLPYLGLNQKWEAAHCHEIWLVNSNLGTSKIPVTEEGDRN